jgi:hypothetical protein
MNETLVGPTGLPPGIASTAASSAPGLAGWVREGLRAAFLLRPRVDGHEPRPRVLLPIALFALLLDLIIGRLVVDGPAEFDAGIWLAANWGLAACALLVWALLWRPEGERRGGAASWITLWLVASLVPGTLSQVLDILTARELLPDPLANSGLFAWGSYLGLCAWSLAIVLCLGRHFGLGRGRVAVLGAGFFLVFAVTAWQFPDPPWQAPADDDEDQQQLELNPQSFQVQQVLFDKAVQGLAAREPGRINVYGIVFAPYGLEDVFLRESTMVADVLEQRFDAQGRVLELVNNPATGDMLPWATPENLKRAIDAIAGRMDRDKDLLVLYLTSHGASGFELAAANPPLQIDTITPTELRNALDEAGIKHRVIAISACFSGGWVGPLASDSTLVMTAADAKHTSYGCGRLSPLTFFGRAVFDEQLRGTHSFEQAFAAAVPVIRQREIEGHKPDGFSNPQISVGSEIHPLLVSLQRRLDAEARP